ncbi:MAG: DUF2089 domain-containing protein [Armatimonadota bacterium]|nr:DUF2089 domain-containing protein [Armatimonadota bacterium]MDR7452092.1 DUF2089 domain-containing protein [Armatimonadota bacterium]MDR7466554.1 DUF2089 domain-containing protein [Armatimonadota bacterium]MDR7493276.1 DUF2089 domain-containing protein [Armatimonadota bacterium]MDR7499831.1 DUF2089 domain-containing protein [Armatimonadota bacterium]
MPQAPGKCPVCGSDLEVIRLQCASCGTAVEGHFELSKFTRLTPEQLAFLELFLKARGNIKEVERELGLSYPTVRARLDALLAALGYAVEPDRRAELTKRREILDALDAGKISAEEALRLLRERR